MAEEVAYPEENLNWWVSVMHTDSETEIAQVKSFVDFRPLTLDDPLPKDKVILSSRKWTRPPKDKKYRVYVTNFAETKSGLDNVPKTRARLPPLIPQESDILTSDSDVERKRKREANAKKNAVMKERQRKTEIVDFGKYLLSVPCPVGTAPCSSTPQDGCNEPSTSKGLSRILSSESQNQVLNTKSNQIESSVKPVSSQIRPKKPVQPTVVTNIVTSEAVRKAVEMSDMTSASKAQSPSFNLNSDLPFDVSNIKISSSEVNGFQGAQILYTYSECEKDAEIQALKAKLEALRLEKETLIQEKQQRELNPLSEGNLITKISTLVAAELKAEFRNLPNKEDFSKLEVRVNNIEEAIKNCEWSSRGSHCRSHSASLKSSSSGKKHIDEIHLGQNVFVTETAHIVMKTTSDVDEFANALLLGVLKEEAKRYRKHPRIDGNLPFPDAFKAVAKAEYSAFLTRIGHKPPFAKKTLNKILTLMSRKAIDLNGRRNKPSSLNPSMSSKKRKTDESVEMEAVLDPETGLLIFKNGGDAEHEESGDEEDDGPEKEEYLSGDEEDM